MSEEEAEAIHTMSAWLDDDDLPPHYWHGRKWNAPMTDHAQEMSEEQVRTLLDGSHNCVMCQEPLLADQNVIQTPYGQLWHLECEIRSALGDVQHLEGRCICDGGTDAPLPGENERSYREESLATVQWLIDHRRGGFHD